MNLHLHHSEQLHLLKPLKMTTPGSLPRGKSFHPWVSSTCNRWWLRNAMIGLKNSNWESLKRARRLSKSTQSLLHQEKIWRLLKPLPSPTYIKILNQHNLKISKEEELVKRRAPNSPGASRVPHGYTTGTNFLNRTRTRVHRTRSRCGYIPYRNFRGFIRNPRYELYPRFLSLKYIVNYMIIL